MSLQAVLTNLLLPPLFLVLLTLAAGLLAWHRRFAAAPITVLSALGVLLLATPFVAGTLTVALESQVPRGRPTDTPPPSAIIVLGGEMAGGEAEPEPGPLTLERLRAAAALHRRTGLPLLVTGGVVGRGAPPVAELMAASLQADFGIPARWIEPCAADTRQNALFSAAMLRADEIGAAFVVSHAWHLPRALGAFARAGFPVTPAPVRRGDWPAGLAPDWVPRPDHLTQSWFALREWAGLLVYRLRDSG
ncbi:YdcF family protein [Belnapia moabensis]|uniref:YdcF family protein n=1 Tax=Belnapia moabensis TaxID=365533 RepID=UPI0005BC303E|nr:YdcF family protein [Belnapia moabensis]